MNYTAFTMILPDYFCFHSCLKMRKLNLGKFIDYVALLMILSNEDGIGMR
jgi:hypothetical protein